MSLLSLEKRAEVIAHLCEGAGIRATSRLSNVSKPTVLSLLLKIGRGCDRLHDRIVRDLSINNLQLDELWSFIFKKSSRVTAQDPPSYGDCYTWLALARTQKLIVSYRVGKRDDANAQAFAADLRSRLVSVPMLVSDGFASYATAIGAHFETVDYAQVQKNYSRSPRRVRDGQPSDHRYEPPRDPFCVRKPIFGAPDMSQCSTSHVERLNLDVRMMTRRLTRLCNGFSRSLVHHTAAMSLFVAHTNFCRIHGALRVTPAMEAGIVDRLWSVEELVQRALDAADMQEVKPEKRPLALPVVEQAPAVPARELPNGRGWLRLVTGGDAPAPKPPTPGPMPAAPAPAACTPASEAPAVDSNGQLDLFSWKPKPRVLPPLGVQLNLFE